MLGLKGNPGMNSVGGIITHTHPHTHTHTHTHKHTHTHTQTHTHSPTHTHTHRHTHTHTHSHTHTHTHIHTYTHSLTYTHAYLLAGASRCSRGAAFTLSGGAAPEGPLCPGAYEYPASERAVAVPEESGSRGDGEVITLDGAVTEADIAGWARASISLKASHVMEVPVEVSYGRNCSE